MALQATPYHLSYQGSPASDLTTYQTTCPYQRHTPKNYAAPPFKPQLSCATRTSRLPTAGRMSRFHQVLKAHCSLALSGSLLQGRKHSPRPHFRHGHHLLPALGASVLTAPSLLSLLFTPSDSHSPSLKRSVGPHWPPVVGVLPAINNILNYQFALLRVSSPPLSSLMERVDIKHPTPDTVAGKLLC